MGRPLAVFRTGLTVVATVFLLAACGAGTAPNRSAPLDSSAAGSPSAPPPSVASSAPRAGTPFCLDMANEVAVPDPASMSSLRADPAKYAQLLTQLADQIRVIEPPAELATSWKTLGDGLQVVAHAYATADPHDPAWMRAFAQHNAAFVASLKEAALRIQAYLAKYCGITSSVVSSI